MRSGDGKPSGRLRRRLRSRMNNIRRYKIGIWEWYSKYIDNDNTIKGKYLFFSDNRDILEYFLLKIFKKFKLSKAKIPLPGKQINKTYVLCIYSDSENEKIKSEFNKILTNYPNITFSGWKSDEDTLNGKYSKIFYDSLKVSKYNKKTSWYKLDNIDEFSKIFKKKKMNYC